MPAISEFEGYLRSTGQIIGFGFDDFVFEPDGLASLHAIMRAKGSCFVHGEGKMISEENDITLGDARFPHDNLFHHNFLANGAVLVSREAIESVGLYDPHIVLARLCDFDLWRRLRRRFNFEAIPLLVGREYGASRSDSLGNTYPMQYEVINEFMGIDRNKQLVPSAFLERDVLYTPADASYPLRHHIEELKEFFSTKSWFPAHALRKTQNAAEYESAPRRTVAVVGSLTASVALDWIGDPGSPLDFINHVDPEQSIYLTDPALAKSDLVVFAREIMTPHQQRIIKRCRNLKIPHVYFADDNFPELAKTNRVWAEYNVSRLRNELRSFSGVILSSEKLREYFSREKLHPRLDVIGPIFLQSQLQKCSAAGPLGENEAAYRIATFGGLFRMQNLVHNILPVIRDLPGQVQLFTRDVNSSLGSRSVEHITIPETSSFFRFLKLWARKRPHVVVHPAGRSTNIDYKCESAILISLYLGAVPVVADEQAYRMFDVEDGVEKVSDTPEAWREALIRLQDPVYRAAMLARLRRTCETRFTDGEQRRILDSYLQGLPVLDAHRYASRCRALMGDRREQPQSDFRPGEHGYCQLNRAVEIVGSENLDGISSGDGFLDEVTGGSIVMGWAMTHQHDQCELLLEIDGYCVGSFSANLFRIDLQHAGYGDGRYAFWVKVPDIFRDENAHEVSVKFALSGQHLGRSPMTCVLR